MNVGVLVNLLDNIQVSQARTNEHPWDWPVKANGVEVTAIEWDPQSKEVRLITGGQQ